MSVLIASEADLVERWPVYHHELARRTPYRATLSFPIARSGAAFAALNLYCTDSRWTLRHELDTTQRDIVDLIGALLLLSQIHQPGTDDHSPGMSRQRLKVWVAIGRLREAGGLTDVEAIALLRGHAFATDQLLDDVALHLVQGRLSADDVLAER